MQYIKGIDAFREEKRTAVTLGKFDGLHRGHQKLIEKIRSYAGNDCVSVVCAFDMQRSCLKGGLPDRLSLYRRSDDDGS